MFHRSFQRVKAKNAYDPQLVSGSTILTGNIIDRKDYQAGLLSLNFGATTGTPTGTQLAVIVQHGDAANLSDSATYVTVAASLGAADANFTAGTELAYDINLEGAKRYVRFAVTPTFTAGTTPKVNLCASLALEDGTSEPSGQSVIALP